MQKHHAMAAASEVRSLGARTPNSVPSLAVGLPNNLERCAAKGRRGMLLT